VELRHLRYFVAVAEMGNVSRAATQRLHVAQPSLSRQIRDLEEAVGVPLLERTPRGVRLTDAGRAFLDEARAILKYTNEAVLKTRGIGGNRETELHVGDFPLVAARMMPRLLRDYQRAMPSVHVRLHDWPVEKEIAAVCDGQLQLAIIIPPLTGDWRRQLRFEELMSLRVCLAVSRNHPFAQRKAVSLAEAAREPFIGLLHEEFPQHRVYVDAIFARVKDKPRFVEEHDGWAGLFSAVDAGAGVAIASDAFDYAFGNRVRFLPLTPEPKRVPLGVISLKGRLSPAAEKFCLCAREAFSAAR
jgi:LysR family transcriptional regulator, benzoate and cis,cis-muconate-responsive activator of ben and cat genes